MNKQQQIKDFLLALKEKEGDAFEWNDKELFSEKEDKTIKTGTLAIKVLSIFGGFLATLAFLAFLFISGLNNTTFGLVFFGVLFIVLSIIGSRIYDKIVIDTSAISLYVCGYALLAFGLSKMDFSDTLSCLLYIVIAFVALNYVRSFIFYFISFLIIFTCIIAIFSINNLYNAYHLLSVTSAILFFYLFQFESIILDKFKRISIHYEPLRIAFICTFIFMLYVVSTNFIFPVARSFSFISNITNILLISYFIFENRITFNIIKNSFLVWTFVAVVLLLLPTIHFPAISGSILILLCCFRSNYKTGFALGLLSLIYFVSQFYYDLSYTLLVKSILMFTTGIVFLICYFISNKKLVTDENN